MRIGRTAVAVVGFTAGLVGAVAAVAGWQLQTVQKAGDAKPRALTVTELAEAGTGGNAHIELTGFKFGKPVVETGKDGEWTAVWVPVRPARDPAKPLFRTVYLRTTHVDDQGELDALLKQTTLRTLVASSFGSPSLFAVKPSAQLWKAEPNLDPARTVFLCDAQLDLNGAPVLVGDQLFNRTLPLAAWVVVGVAFTLVVIGLAVGSTPRERRGTLPPDRATHREALFQEPPISHHHGLYGNLIALALVLLVLGVPVLAGSGLWATHTAVVGATRGFMGPEQLGYVAGMGVVAVVAFGALWVLTAASIISFRGAIAEVVMCNHGLRWRVGKKWDAVLWSDVKSVTRGETVIMQHGREVNRVGVCRVTLRDGRVLALAGTASPTTRSWPTPSRPRPTTWWRRSGSATWPTAKRRSARCP